jgi:hypothetical protein
MDFAGSDFCRRHLARVTLCTGLFVVGAASTALAEDARCEQLVALHHQYAGVTLTSEQQGLKRKLVAWYNTNCARMARATGR